MLCVISLLVLRLTRSSEHDSETWVIRSVSVGCHMIVPTASTSRVAVLRTYPMYLGIHYEHTPRVGYSCYEHSLGVKYSCYDHTHTLVYLCYEHNPLVACSCYVHTPTSTVLMLRTYPHISVFML